MSKCGNLSPEDDTHPAHVRLRAMMPSPPASFARVPAALIVVLLVAVTLLACAWVGQCGFVNLDDDAYVEFQPLVNGGLRSAGLAWAFTGSHSSNWHPLTTISHMLDCQVF